MFLCGDRGSTPRISTMKKSKELLAENGPMTIEEIMAARKAGILNGSDVLELAVFLVSKKIENKPETVLNLALVM